MSDILARFASMDLLGLIFLGGGLAFLWAIWKVLSDDLDLGGTPPQEAGAPPPVVHDDVPTVPPPAPTGPRTPRAPSRRRRAA